MMLCVCVCVCENVCMGVYKYVFVCGYVYAWVRGCGVCGGCVYVCVYVCVCVSLRSWVTSVAVQAVLFSCFTALAVAGGGSLYSPCPWRPSCQGDRGVDAAS